jgi:hypothetical protein
LIKIILLQHFYPNFYRVLVDPRVHHIVDCRSTSRNWPQTRTSCP